MSNDSQLCAQRYVWIDILRGIAILLMVPANFAGILSEPYSILFRILSSNAAPIFIIVSVGMVVINASKHSIGYYMYRGMYIILIAMLLDFFVIGVVPFHSFNVLYIIGIGLPVGYLVRELDDKYLISLMFLVFAISFILQYFFGYNKYLLFVDVNNIEWVGVKSIASSFFIDGLFPIFPWLGYVFFGVWFFRYVFFKEGNNIPLSFVYVALIVSCIGYVFLLYPPSWIHSFVSGGLLNTRGGIAEIFYPPSLAFLLSTLSVFVLLAYLIKLSSNFKMWYVVNKFGQYSMLIYLVHKILIYLVSIPLLEKMNINSIKTWQEYSMIMLVVFVILFIICVLTENIKKYWKPKSVFIKLIIGS